MIDDFQRPPEKKPARLDTFRNPDGSNGSGSQTGDYPQSSNGYNNYAPPRSSDPSANNYDTLPEPVDSYNHAVTASKPKSGFLGRLKNLSRKQVAVIGLVLLLTGGGTAYALTRPEPPPPPPPKQTKVAPKPTPKPITSPLTGMVVTADLQARPVTGVMIENSMQARPQSGLIDAGIVFEAISEYGITRFLALYQETAPGNVGPVRSVRPYFIDWVMPFDAALAHVGGSPEALERIRTVGTKDLDQFHTPGPYRRINTRYAPHNMYTSIDGLIAAGKAKGYEKSNFTPIERKAKEEPNKTPPAKNIGLAISSAAYNVHYNYDPVTNSYKRIMGGKPHMDHDTQAQIEAKVVVALSMSYSLQANGLHSSYGTTGTGLAHFFQDGNVTTGSWSKADHTSQFVFKDDAGNPVKLNAGKTWITVVGDPGKVSYTP